MRDWIEIDTTPVDEPCLQVGDDNYAVFARVEAKAFYQQILRTFGNPPEGVELKLSRANHDFGTYIEIRICFDDENEAGVDYAFKIEGDLPQKWDTQALEFLKTQGYPFPDAASHTSSMKEASDLPVQFEGDDQSFLVTKTTMGGGTSCVVFHDEVMDFYDVVSELRSGGYSGQSSGDFQSESEEDPMDASEVYSTLHIEDMYGRDIAPATRSSLMQAAGLSTLNQQLT